MLGKKLNILPLIAAIFTAVLLSGCTSTIDCSYDGLSTPDGQAIAHVNAFKVGCNFFALPMINDPTLRSTFKQLTDEAKRLNGTKVRVMESNISHLWWSFPPFTFIFIPVISEVAGDVYP